MKSGLKTARHLFAVLLLLGGFSAAVATAAQPDLSTVAQKLDQEDHPFLDVIILHRGAPVLTFHRKPERKQQANRVYSVTKSVLSLLIGIAIQEQRFPDLDTPLGELFPAEIAQFGAERVAALTLRHLLTMTTGQPWSEAGGPMWEWTFSKDRHHVLLQLPVIDPPGTRFQYNTAASDMLGVILEKSTQIPLPDYARTRLFAPLGIRDVDWRRRGGRYVNMGAGLSIRPDAMAKIGQLVLQQGRWDTHQIVPSDWIAEATRPHIPVGKDYSYGFQWWQRDVAGCRSFRAVGHGGQYIVVVPEKALVVALTARARSLTGGANRRAAGRLITQITKTIPGGCAHDRTHAHWAVSHPLPEPDRFARLDDGMKTRLAAFENALRTGDLEKVMSFYDPNFAVGERKLDAERQFWSGILPKMQQAAFHMDLQYPILPGLDYLSGTLRSDEIRFPVFSHARWREDRWLWQGGPFGASAPVELPEELRQFIDRFQSSVRTPGFDAVSGLISDAYQANGLTKADLADIWRETKPWQRDATIRIYAYERTENGFLVDGEVSIKYVGNVPLKHLYGVARRENGQLRWYGNQRRSALIPDMP